MVQVSYPGVYVQEIASGSRTITGVSTSIAMFIGRTERGPMFKPTRVFSYSEFTRKFGEKTILGELPTAVRLFFANGGTQAYVTRIASGAGKAAVTLENLAGVPVLMIEAREEGARGSEIRVAIDYNTPDPGSTFNLRVFRVDPATLAETEVELHTDLSMLPTATRNVADVLAQNSALVTAEIVDPASSVKGTATGARLIPGAAEAAQVISFLGAGPWNMILELDGIPTDVIEFASADIETTLAENDVELNFLTAGAGGPFAVVFERAVLGSVRVLPTGLENDIATFLQFGPSRGGIDRLYNADLRPAPSGAILKGDANLAKIGGLTQGLVTLTVDSVEFSDLPVSTNGTLYYEGYAAGYLSLANLREKLDLLAGLFNARAANTANFPWRLEVQGYLLVFRSLTGTANSGTGMLAETSNALINNAAGYTVDNSNVRYYALTAGGGGYQQAGASGDEGYDPSPSAYEDAYDVIRRDVDLFNLLILPRSKDDDDSTRRVLWGPASVFCKERRAFLLIDPPAQWKGVGDITSAEVNITALRTGLVKDHAAVYFPRLTVSEGGITKFVDPAGAVAGIMARIDGSRGVWKAPAGIEADVRAITGVERMVSDPDSGVLNPQAINAIRVFANGIVTWGARTMDGFDNSGNDDYKYVPVRRLSLFIAESLSRGLKFAVFEPNDEPLWAQIRLAAGGFMNNLFRQGAFQGQKKSEAYFVKVDNETTTQNDINLGIVNVVVGFAPLKPAEFVVVTIQQIAGQVQV